MVSCANQEQKDKTQDEKIGRFLSGVSHTLMFMSGKGGVGKSTTAVNAALFLSDLGYRVGLLDIDIHGPSVAGLLGLKGMPLNIVCDKIQPFQMNENLRVVTFQGFLENPDQPIIWRGPVKMGVILQLLADVDWGELDFLIIDSPPGTGDEPLTIAQRIPDCRAVIITTPQEIALADVRKSLNFCKQTNIRIMGIIENMSGFVCPTCGVQHDIFKSGGGEKTAAQWGVPFLGKIPIDPGVVEAGDLGSGIVKADSPAKGCLEDIVRRITDNLKQEKGDGQMAMKIGIPLAGEKLCNHFGHCEEFALVSVTGGEITDVTKRVPPPHEPGVIPNGLRNRAWIRCWLVAWAKGRRISSAKKESEWYAAHREALRGISQRIFSRGRLCWVLMRAVMTNPATSATGGEIMKIAVTTSGTELSDRFDTRFGRAANFIIYDIETGQWECHTNKQNYDAVQGAGIQAAQTVGRLGVSALVTGHVGPKAFKVLQASGIKAFAAEVDTARDAIGAFRRGELTEMAGPDVEGHWL